MKTKLLLSALLLLSPFSFLLSPCSAQVPLGFNYQAIARNGTGIPITNQTIPVRISIVTSLTGGTVIWQEDHLDVTSNANGLISLVVGTGTQTGGSATSFSSIDWGSQILYLKTEVKYPGPSWTDMGTSQIWAVPYSLTAKEVTGPLSKLGITGTTDVMDEALFEVKNKKGNTVFAVYNEGIRAYVGDGSAKGVKGGFSVGGYDASKSNTVYDIFVLSTDSARFYLDSKPKTTKGVRGGFSVGGYDMTKGVPQNYLHVSKDSVRIYVDSNPATKGVKGGFSVGGYDMTKGGTPVSSYLNVETNASGIINPSQNRILWYPLKNAFLTGRVRIGTPDSVGVNSFATGYESKARGMYSQAMGFKAIANGDYSTAIGKNAHANSINSFAFGDSAQAINNESYALGKGAVASGFRSFAFGSAGVDQLGKPTGVAYAKGDYSFAIGQGSQSLGKGAFALGIADTARGDYSTAMGLKSTASGYNSTAYGFYNIAKGWASVSMGFSNNSNGDASLTMGVFSTANGYASIALGSASNASGNYSTAIGQQNSANGTNSTAMGTFNKAIGDYSTAMGAFTTATGNYSTAMDRETNANGQNSTAMGYQTSADGEDAVAMGYKTTAPSFCETVVGSQNTSYSLHSGMSTFYWIPEDRLFVIGNGWGTPSNAVTVLKNGNVGIGTDVPGYNLTVNGTAWCSSGAWTGSDIRWKKNITDITDVLSNVMALNPVTYQWKTDEFPEMNFSNDVQIGLIAQDVEKLFPNLVMTDNKGYKAVSYEKLSVVLLEGMKEQQKQIETQQKEIDELKTLVNSLIANQTARGNK